MKIDFESNLEEADDDIGILDEVTVLSADEALVEGWRIEKGQ